MTAINHRLTKGWVADELLENGITNGLLVLLLYLDQTNTLFIAMVLRTLVGLRWHVIDQS